MQNMNTELPALTPGSRPPVLLLGNGVNQLFEGTPWKTIIADFSRDSGIACEQSALEKLPATMQIVTK